MVDNTQVTNGNGDVIRDIDRGGVKTQVMQLDAGGQFGEQLVSNTNPLPVSGNVNISIATNAQNGQGLPVNDANLTAAQTQDQPIFISVAGDPAGDFAGVNILEKLVDDSGDLKMAVRVVNPPKLDINGAQMVSDAPNSITITSPITTGVIAIIDTQGYASCVAAVGSFGSSLQQSNDLINWFSVPVVYLSNITNSIASATLNANSLQVFGCYGRYTRLIGSTSAGTVVLTLRVSPPPFGTGVVLQAGNTSTWNVNGATAAGSAAVATQGGNPVVVGGVDSGTPGVLAGVSLVRRLLSDNQGRVRLAAEATTSTPGNSPIINTQDASNFEGQSLVELIAQVIVELRVMNRQLFDINVGIGSGVADEPQTIRDDIYFGVFNQ
jgi:hypothetical protein